ncbi:MAG: hypothetical protein LEGION0403_FIIPPAGN_01665 [Legionella sp.]|uniref:hypothetical protein n=1 Tax=Legionella sp. TaxID=459 RepID=UPI003D0EE558
MDKETNKILAAIHKDYVKKLHPRIVALEITWLQITESESDEDGLCTCYREIHDLSGSSGTHGYKELSKILRELDKIFSSILQNGMDFVNKKKTTDLLTQAKKAVLVPPDTPDMFKEY